MFSCPSLARSGRLLVLPKKSVFFRRVDLPRLIVFWDRNSKLKPASPSVAAPDRRAAEHIISVGGLLMTDRSDQWTDVVPEGLFRLTGVDLERKRVTDEGLAAFQGCSALETLNLSWTGITDTGVVNF